MPGLYVQLDTNWPDHPRVIAVGLEGAALHAIALCLAKRFLTDGVLWRAQLRRYGAGDELIDRLVEIGLLERVDDDRVAVHDWLDRNPSRGAIGGRLGAMSAEGKRGNHKRWSHPGDIADCPKCNPTKTQVVPMGDRGPIGSGIATRSGRVARDIDRDREKSDPTVATVAAARQRALDGNAQIRHLTETNPDPELNAAGANAARAALHPTPTEPTP